MRREQNRRVVYDHLLGLLIHCNTFGYILLDPRLFKLRDLADYAIDIVLQPLEVVAAKTQVMDDAFISPAGNDVTAADLIAAARAASASWTDVPSTCRTSPMSVTSFRAR